MRRWKTFLAQVVGLLGLYLEDLLLIAGGSCLTAAAALRWGEAAGLAAGGAFLLVLSFLAARSGRR